MALQVGTWRRGAPLVAAPSLKAGAERASRLPLIPLAILVVLLIVPALFAEWIAPHDPLEGSLVARLQPPAWEAGGSTTYLLGTDKQGRDLLSRIIYGARISLQVSIVAVILSGAIGTVLGLVSGYYGGAVDTVIMRLVDISLSLPLVLIGLVLVIVMGPGLMTVVVVVSLLLWSRYARQIRGEALAIRNQDYIARARVAGSSDARIIALHVFPNIVNTLIVLATLNVGQVILLEATLSFLGAGIPRPQPSWGVMVADGRDHIVAAWWIAMVPGLAIMLVVLAMNMVGDWLRDQLDPRLRQA
jgi:peptide/nickel transport system permease protein